MTNIMSRVLSTLLFLGCAVVALGQVNSVGIIGTATAGGWSSDTPMVQDAQDPNKWTLSITLSNGEAKFRANGSWDINWGATGFPFGTGVQNGPNITIIGGTYNITFNSATGEYFFDLTSSDIGIIGSATPFGWNREVFMFQDQADTNSYYLTLNLTQAECKFRANGSWDVNWGADAFPSGIGVQNGPNIPIAAAGKYNITFNKATGAYNFVEQVDFTSISLIGSATAGGWGEDTPLTRDSNDPNVWRGNVTLNVGEVKFRANNSWAINWGGNAFPSGVGELNGPNIMIPDSGDYLVTFNTSNLAYSFLVIGNYNTVSIIGDATPGGWDTDTPMTQDANDRSIWRLRIVLNTGEAKFRANNDWAINWGGGTFPTGVATQDGPNIPIVGGEYRITFNSTTGAYSFEEVFEYRAVSLVGKSGPFNAWPEPGDGGARDLFMTKDPEDPHRWTLASVTLRNFEDDTDGGVKFRADTSWAVNWGSIDFPSGIGRQDGPNIRPVAGTYSVVFNSLSGEYVFSPVSSIREDLLDPSAIKLVPNPASQQVTIFVNSDRLGQNLQVLVFDRQGRQVMQQRFDSLANLRLNVSQLPAGTYTLSISDGKHLIGKQLVVVR